MCYSIVISSLVVLLGTLTTFAGQVPKKSEVPTAAQRTMLEALLQDAKTLDEIVQRGQDTRVDMAQYRTAVDAMGQRDREIREKLPRTDLRILACLMTNSYIDLGQGLAGATARGRPDTPQARAAMARLWQATFRRALQGQLSAGERDMMQQIRQSAQEPCVR